MIARKIYTCSTTRKQTNVVYIIEFRLSPDFAANPYTFALKKLEVIYVYLHFSQQPCVIFLIFTFAALLQSWGQTVLSSPLVSAGVTNGSEAPLVACSTNSKQSASAEKKIEGCEKK